MCIHYFLRTCSWGRFVFVCEIHTTMLVKALRPVCILSSITIQPHHFYQANIFVKRHIVNIDRYSLIDCENYSKVDNNIMLHEAAHDRWNTWLTKAEDIMPG